MRLREVFSVVFGLESARILLYSVQESDHTARGPDRHNHGAA
jgi:hypothetical protein